MIATTLQPPYFGGQRQRNTNVVGRKIVYVVIITGSPGCRGATIATHLLERPPPLEASISVHLAHKKLTFLK